MHPEFADVPTYRGYRLDYTAGEDEYNFYIEWLADYLHRPIEGVAALEEKEARLAVVGVEIDMASDLWERTFEEDRIIPIGPRHADFLYREDLSRVLSRVSDRDLRIRLIHWLYREFNIDAYK